MMSAAVDRRALPIQWRHRPFFVKQEVEHQRCHQQAEENYHPAPHAQVSTAGVLLYLIFLSRWGDQVAPSDGRPFSV